MTARLSGVSVPARCFAHVRGSKGFYKYARALDQPEKVLSDDSMSIMLFGLFLICIFGQSLTGWFAYNSSLQ